MRGAINRDAPGSILPAGGVGADRIAVTFELCYRVSVFVAHPDIVRGRTVDRDVVEVMRSRARAVRRARLRATARGECARGFVVSHPDDPSAVDRHAEGVAQPVAGKT